MNPTELEKKILDTAERLFLEKGFNGTSTTDIARAVGCNQALMHYYYRTKEKLFSDIYMQKIEQFLNYANLYKYDGDFYGFVNQMVCAYFDFLNTHRQLPFFIINELALNKDRRCQIKDIVVQNQQKQEIYYSVDKIIQDEIKKGTIKPIETFDLLINCLSLVAMTFLTLPMVTDFLQKTPEQVDQYLENRKKEIMTSILCRLKPEQTI